MRNKIMTMALLTAGLMLGLVKTNSSLAQEEGQPKSIKVVMKEAHKSGLLKNVALGKASPEDQQKLLALYKDMAKQPAPVGDVEDWKQRTTLLVKAVESTIQGAEGAKAQLTKASNCKACHMAHKPQN